MFALAIRVHWNLEVHPPSAYDYSDMHGYVARAEQILDDPYSADPYSAFYPFGTSWLIAVVKYWFGRENDTALALAYALWGSLIIPVAYGIARRIETHPWVAPTVGFFLAIYYPLIAHGGYTLSEIPASLTLCLAVWLLLRLIDEQRWTDAIGLGLMLGIATTIRTQMIVNIALVGILWLATLKNRPALYPALQRRLIGVALPLIAVLGLSTARVYYHTGHVGLVSENGPINLIFGRCHVKGVTATRKGGFGRFSPPPIIQLESHSARHPDSWIQLAPVFGDHPEPVEGVPEFQLNGPIGCKYGCSTPGVDLQYEGYIGDTKLQRKIVRACIERGGWGRQIYYSAVHVLQLWKYNSMWPDSANPKPRPVDRNRNWRAISQRWKSLHNVILAIPALLSLSVLWRPRTRPKLALVAVNFASVIIVAAVVMGGQRFRLPYDPLIVILAFHVWSIALSAAFFKLRARFIGHE